MRASRTALLLLAGAAVLLLLHYYPRMPDAMASHFDGAGRPNAFATRDGFFLLSGAMLVLVLVVFEGTGFLFRRLPPKRFNLPHRDYWLAPERRAETVDFMVRQMEWFGAASMLLLLLTLRAAFDANLNADKTLDSASLWWVLGAYFLYTAIWLFRFVMHFRRTESAAAS